MGDTRTVRSARLVAIVSALCALAAAALIGAAALCHAPAAYAADEAAPAASAPHDAFPDLPNGMWYVDEGWADYVIEHKIMGGHTAGALAGHFDPDGLITRGQVMTIIFRHANPDSDATSNVDHFAKSETFTDVADYQYYTAAVEWCYKNKIVTGDTLAGSGDPAWTVRPEHNITRQEITAMLYRYAKFSGADLTGANAWSYAAAPDAAAVPEWASEGMGWCYANRVLTGDKGTGMLRPADSATRAQMAKMITVVARDVLSPSEKGVVYSRVPILTTYDAPDSGSASRSVPYMTKFTFVREVSSTAAGTWTEYMVDGETRYVWQAAGSASKFTNEKSSFVYAGSTDFENKAIAQAMLILNSWKTDYVSGAEGEIVSGTTDVHGFDCSGFASFVTNSAVQRDIPVYRASANLQKLYKMADPLYNAGLAGEMRAKTVWTRGQALDKGALKPGDMLFFNLAEEAGDGESAGKEVNHVGLYLGNGEFIHCTHTWDRVIIMPLSDFYEQGLVSVRRYLPESTATANKEMVTTSTQTKFRSSMDSSANANNIIAVLDSEVPVTLLYTSETANWGYVDVAGTKGFILMEYLKEPAAEQSVAAWVSATSVRLYEEPSSKTAYVDAYCTDEITLHGMKSGTTYYKVTYKGQTRYISLANKNLDDVVTQDYNALIKGYETKTVKENTFVRSTPSTAGDDNKIELVASGTSVRVIAQSSTKTWCYVGYGDGRYGFVLSSKLG